MSFLAWLGQRLTRHEETPEVEVIMRDYEWYGFAQCINDGLNAHRYIEWMPDLVTTRECLGCGLETEVAREAGSEAVDH